MVKAPQLAVAKAAVDLAVRLRAWGPQSASVTAANVCISAGMRVADKRHTRAA